MPRIRTIKPEFWQDKKLAACSPHARLLSVALLQLCDANGVFLNIPMQVHAHAFPWEPDVNVQALLGELQSISYVFLYEVDGKEYGYIPGFRKHQRLQGNEASSDGLHPLPDRENMRFLEDGSNEELPGNNSVNQEQGTGNREQGTGKGDAAASCPQSEIVNLYHEVLPQLRGVREWTDERQKLLRSRWREKPERQDLDWWRGYFERVSRSDFLMGRVSGDGRAFQADLEWLIRPKNMPKVLEGKYDNAKKPKVAEI